MKRRACRPQRIFNTRGDHGADRDAAGLADALDAERIERRRRLQMRSVPSRECLRRVEADVRDRCFA